MENKYAISLAILALVIGMFAGAMIFSTHTVEEARECPAIAVTPVCEPVIETVTIIEESDLDLAVKAFLEAVEDEEVEDVDNNKLEILGNYDFDEMTIKKVYDTYSVSKDDEETTVKFSIKLRLKEEDQSSITKIYNVTVIMEDDEDTIVTAVKLR